MNNFIMIIALIGLVAIIALAILSLAEYGREKMALRYMKKYNFFLFKSQRIGFLIFANHNNELNTFDVWYYLVDEERWFPIKLICGLNSMQSSTLLRNQKYEYQTESTGLIGHLDRVFFRTVAEILYDENRMDIENHLKELA